MENKTESMVVQLLTAKLEASELVFKAAELTLQAATIELKTARTALQDLKSRECTHCDKKGLCAWPGGYRYHCPKCFVFGFHHPSADVCMKSPSVQEWIKAVVSGTAKKET